MQKILERDWFMPTCAHTATPKLRRLASLFGCRRGFGTPHSHHTRAVHFHRQLTPQVWWPFYSLHFGAAAA
jgi:hypothetical protein